MRAFTEGRSGPRAAMALLLAALLLVGLSGASAPANAQERFGRRRQMLELTNRDRSRRERDRLEFAAALSRYARLHSEAMARRGRIFHSTPEQLRAALDGHRWTLAGENVGVGSTLEGLEQAFMGSKSHRQNILRSVFENAAVGVVVDDEGHYWVTVIFYG